MPFHDTAENERGGRERGFQRVADQVCQIIRFHAFARGDLVRVHEDEGSELAGHLPNRLQRRIVEIAAFNIRSDVHADEPQFAYRPTKLPNRKLRRLHGERCQGRGSVSDVA